MTTASLTYSIFAGSPVSASSAVTLLGAGSDGDRTALRRLVYPTISPATTPDFAPLTYESNPTRMVNFDNIPLPSPRVSTPQMLDTTAVVRFEGVLSDVIVTEIWTAQTSLSMRSAFFRKLYEYYINPPPFDPVTPQYIQWEPRDRSDDGAGNTRVYNVEIVRMTVGGGGQANQLFDIADIKPVGGLNDPRITAASMDPVDGLGPVFSGLLDRTVVLQLKIVDDATP